MEKNIKIKIKKANNKTITSYEITKTSSKDHFFMTLILKN